MLCRSLTPDEEKELREDAHRHGPHGQYSIMVRVSPDAAAAYRENRPLPLGAIVVKEKYVHGEPVDPSRVLNREMQLREYAVMTKRREESAARGGGWEYAYVELAPEPKVASGNLDHGAECHASARDRDFLFRSQGTSRR